MTWDHTRVQEDNFLTCPAHPSYLETQVNQQLVFRPSWLECCARRACDNTWNVDTAMWRAS